MTHDVDFNQPQTRKVRCPIVDMHTHVGDPAGTALLVESARLYEITKIIGIASLDNARVLDDAFPGYFDFAVSLDYRLKDDARQFERTNLRLIENAARFGAKIVKFWFKPVFNADQKMKLDDERLSAIFDRMAELNLTGLVHIADPDIWFIRQYADVARYGTKRENFTQLENILSKHPKTKMIGAHMGGYPENLDFLSGMLDAFPNYFIDTSATKWITREVSLKPELSREFFIRYAERILYGSDLVVRAGWPVELYSSRYWIHRVLWETDTVCDLPIEDPDHPGSPQIAGIDLPVDVLEKMYYQNAVRLLNVQLAD